MRSSPASQCCQFFLRCFDLLCRPSQQRAFWHLCIQGSAYPPERFEVPMETAAAQAIEALIADYSKLVFHVIYGLTGHWEESEDLTQDTFIQAFRGIEAARAASGPQFQAKAWLLKIAVNNVRMAQRRQRILRFISFADLQPKRGGDERTSDMP